MNPTQKGAQFGENSAFHLKCQNASFILILNITFRKCLDTRQPGTVFKKLDTRQSEVLTNFLGIARLVPLRT